MNQWIGRALYNALAPLLPRCAPCPLYLLAFLALLLLPVACTASPAPIPASATPTALTSTVTSLPTKSPPAVTPTPPPSVTRPSATPQPPSPTSSPTPQPPITVSGTLTSARVVRRMLPGGRFCPGLALPAPQDAELIGRSTVCRLPIVSYRLGRGESAVILVGGLHGGYEWNTIQLAEEMRRILQDNPDLIPPSLAVYVVPNANPDGLYRVTGRAGLQEPLAYEDSIPGRFNGRNVDLNRNWDCEWSEEAYWGYQPVNAGAEPFSEAETQALSAYFRQIEPVVVLLWHSAATGVYPSGCALPHQASRDLATIFGAAAGYEVYDSFDHYDVTGDAAGWLAAQDIAAITVELTTHSALDLEQNLAGLLALFSVISEQ